MKDKNGTFFTVGSKLQSTQSKGDAGIITCIAVKNGIATLCFNRHGRCFNMNQKNLATSMWVAR